MVPTLSHHEINQCHDAVLHVLDTRKEQLESLHAGNEEVLSDLDHEGVVRCDDQDCNVEFAIAIPNLERVIDRLETLDARLTEILRHCERCGAADDTVGPIFPDTLWLCDTCDERT
jgi:hypothetical protein